MELKKKAIFLGLGDVLIPGDADKKVDEKKVKEILEKLQDLEKKNSITLFLITGLHEEVAVKKIKKSGIAKYFKKENIYYVTKDYIQQKHEIDRQRHLAQLDKDPEFNDRYFKQYIIKKIIDRGKIPKEEMLLIGHDIWTDAFYTMRFSGIDFALLKEGLSERGKKSSKIIKGLIYARRDWKNFHKLLLGRFKKPDYQFLENYIYSELKQQLFGDLEGKIIKAKIDKGKTN